jgi:AMP-binding enzyme
MTSMTSTIIRSPHPEVAIPEVSLPELVFADAARRADKPALIDGLGGRAITYGQLVERARLVAGGLAARGFQPGEVFAIYCPNLPEYAVAFYGVLLAGGRTRPSTRCTRSRSSPPSCGTPAPATCRWRTWARRRPASPCCRSSTPTGRWC